MQKDAGKENLTVINTFVEKWKFMSYDTLTSTLVSIDNV